MNKNLPQAILLLLALLAAPGARAITVDWESALPMLVNTGVETILVRFGFNPQPEPPPLTLVTQDFFNPAEATRQLSGVSPQPFLLFASAEGGSFAVPPEPIADFESLMIPFTTTGGTDLSFLFRFTPNGDGDASTGISDPLFFNPQPEPPPGVGAFGLQFAFEDPGGTMTYGISLQVLDEFDDPLALSPVPLPAAAWLFGGALLGLLGYQRRRRSA